MSNLPEGPDDLVRIRNMGATAFRGKLSPTQYRLIPALPDPRSETIVSWAVACAWLGNPTIVERQVREERLTQLRAYYGVYDDRRLWNREEVLDEKGSVKPILPSLEVYSMTDDSRIHMLLDDPDGSAGLISEVVPAADVAVQMLQRQIAQQAQQMAAMQAELSRFTGAQVAMTPAETVGPAPHPAASIDQAPVVTGRGLSSLSGTGGISTTSPPNAPGGAPAPTEPAGPVLNDDGSMTLPNGTVIPAPTTHYTEAVAPLDDADMAAVAAGKGTLKSGDGGFVKAQATEDKPRRSRA